MNAKLRILLIFSVLALILAALALTKRSVEPPSAGRTPIATQKNLFNSKKKYRVHVVGVEKGQALPGEDTRVWWQKCPDIRNDKSGECHRKYAGETYQTFVEVQLMDLAGEVILVAMSSNTKTRWDIKNLTGVNLTKVVLMGNHAQTATGLSGRTQLEVYTREESPCNHCYRGPVAPTSSSFDERLTPVLENIRKITGEDPISVQLVTETSKFSVSDNMRRFDINEFEEDMRKKKCDEIGKAMLDVKGLLDQPAASADLEYYKQRLNTLKSQSSIHRCMP